MTIGVLGMIVIVFVISLYLNRLYKAVSANPTPLRMLVYLVHAMYAMIIFRDGPVTGVYFILSMSLGAWFICFASSMKNRVTI
jgi:hypothetical protein